MKQASSSTSSPSSPSNGRSSYESVRFDFPFPFLPGDDRASHMRGSRPLGDLGEDTVDLLEPGKQVAGNSIEGDVGLVTASAIGTASNAPSITSKSKSGTAGRSEVVKNGEPRTEVSSLLNGGVSGCATGLG